MQSADQANCLSFIENSMDQLCVPEVKDKIEYEFKYILSNLSVTSKTKSFTKLENFVTKNDLTIVEKFILKQLLESLNPEGISLLEQYMDTFVQYLLGIVQKQADMQEKTW